jgi:hypothetical protein
MLHAVRRLLTFGRRNRLDGELAEEIRLHLDLRRRAVMASGHDPIAFTGAAAFLATAAVLAAWVPARRAATIDRYSLCGASDEPEDVCSWQATVGRRSLCLDWGLQ